MKIYGVTNLTGLIKRVWVFPVAILTLSNVLSGCSGLEVFGQTVAPGDTVSLAIQWQPDVYRDDAEIVITDSVGSTTIPATDSSVRSWVNAYPDPVSKVVVGQATSQGLGVGAKGWGQAIELVTTNGDKDWFQTIVLLDLPGTITPGPATIDVTVNGVSILPQPIALNVLNIAPVSPHDFLTEEYDQLTPNQFGVMERADHYTITFSGGATVPAAIELEMTHDPDKDNSGVGQAYVIPPRGDLKGVLWTDSGTTMKVLVIPTWIKTAEDISRTSDTPETLSWFKFYVAGGVTGLQTTSVSAYDLNGDQVTGVTASIN
ncbi:MAG: hypothetical protein V3W04_08230 [Gammaproteobacteria bacterium]